MPKIDMQAYNEAEETSGGGFAQMTPGGYVLRIMEVKTEWSTRGGRSNSDEKQCVRVVYDVAEGEFANHFADDFWKGEDKDFGHCYYMSWKNMGWLKRQLNAITASNPGFDALAAFQGDNWDAFKGKLLGAVMDGTVDTNDRGYDRWKLEVGDVVAVNDIRSGEYRDPKITDERTKAADGAVPDDFYDDVPL